MARYIVGGNPYKETPLPASAAGCALEHGFWKGETCEPAHSFGRLLTAWGALFSSVKTVKAHCQSSPLLPSTIRKFLILLMVENAQKDYHLNRSLLSNPRVTSKEALAVSESPHLVPVLRANPQLFSLPGVAETYIGQDLGKTDWLASVEGLEDKHYEGLAEDKKTWVVLTANASTPASVLSLISQSEDVAVAILAIQNRNYTVADLICGYVSNSYMEEVVVKAMEDRSEEVTAWLEANHPDLLNVPYEWVRQVLSGGVLA